MCPKVWGQTRARWPAPSAHSGVIFSLSRLFFSASHISPLTSNHQAAQRCDSKHMRFMRLIGPKLPQSCWNTFIHVRGGGQHLCLTPVKVTHVTWELVWAAYLLYMHIQTIFLIFVARLVSWGTRGLCASVMLGSAGCLCPHCCLSTNKATEW